MVWLQMWRTGHTSSGQNYGCDYITNVTMRKHQTQKEEHGIKQNGTQYSLWQQMDECWNNTGKISIALHKEDTQICEEKKMVWGRQGIDIIKTRLKETKNI